MGSGWITSLAVELTDHERASLAAELRASLEAVGMERALTRVTVLPTEKHFPDAWSPDASGVARVLQRLLRFAGIGGCALEMDEDARDRATFSNGWRRRFAHVTDAPVALLGVRDGEPATLRVAVSLAHLASPEVVVGACAREVARADLVLRGALPEEHEQQECAVDAHAFALGFGVLLANAAHVVSTHTGTGAARDTRRADIYLLGGHPPRALAYLLALWTVARGLDARALARHLGVNMAQWMRDDVRALEAHGAAHVAALLALPPGWDAPAALEAPLPAAMNGLVTGPDGVPLGAPPPTVRDDAPVFIVPASRAAAGTVVGVFAGFAAATLAAAPVLTGIGLWFGAIAVGFVGGRLLQRRVCSDPSCGTDIPSGAHACPGCRRVVAGMIRTRDERLHAEERWREERARASRDAEHHALHNAAKLNG